MDPVDPTAAGPAKQRVRAAGAAGRAALPLAIRASAGEVIARRLHDLIDQAGARRVGLYAATADEVALDDLAGRLLAEGRQVALPRVHGPARMTFHLVAGMPATTGAFGIRQPDRTAPPAGPLDVVVVPGVAFDSHGGRVGHGHGYYDRWLATLPARPLLLGAAFSVQLVQRVPRTPTDVDVDVVVTERGIHRAGSRGGMRYR